MSEDISPERKALQVACQPAKDYPAWSSHAGLVSP
jgi:hypothetical protein